MSDAREKKYYAVLIGRNGPAIYTTLKDYRKAIDGLSGSSGKRFHTASQARRWLFGKLKEAHSVIDAVPLVPNDGSIPQTVPLASQVPPALQTPPNTPPRAQPTQLPPPPALPMLAGPEIVLSAEQRCVLEMVVNGKNVFFTGPAGTGKSVLLREILKTLKLNEYMRNKIAITASTGIAALNIGGTTVHSFGGIGLGKSPIKDLVRYIRGKKRLRDRWRATKVLIIDEISMLDASIFDKLEAIGRALQRRDHEEEEWITWKDKDYYNIAPQELPFGGIQLVLSGDFCQLPPVPDHSIDWILPSIFAFDSRSWKRCITSPILLSQVFRQKDKAFVELLSSMRVGKLLPEHVAQIRQLRRPIVYADGIEPSELYPLRGEVERCNDRRLKALTTPIFRYRAMDCAGWDPYLKPVKKKDAEHFLERSRAPEYINLRVGAQVMLLRNIEQGTLVNGSLGKIIEFLTVREAAERKIDIAGESSPAEGSSKHSLADDDDDPVNALPATAVPDFAPPPAFTPLNDHVFAIDQKWPLVKFTNGRELLCSAMTFPSQGFLGNVETLRIQVPLLLAWAMSIHKSQGQTLPRVKIDVGRAFEKGQVYVAISRATCMEGLEIHNFDPGKVEVHPRVIAWQDTWLPRADNRAPATPIQEAAVEEEMVLDDDAPL